MKVKYIGKKQMDYLVKDNFIDLMPNKIYDVITTRRKNSAYVIIDESEEDYCYPSSFFEIVEGSLEEFKSNE